MLTKPDKLKLFTLMGSYPNAMALKEGKITSDLVDFEFADVKVSNTAFKPLVREAKFDLAEVAILTFLQAKHYGKPYVLIPATVVGRGQLHTMAYNPERRQLGPGPARPWGCALIRRPPACGCAVSWPRTTASTSTASPG
jgi:4,5-dihydroxyphthalate decarboxylase